MTSLTQIPYNDIIYLLQQNDQPISEDERENYESAWEFISNNPNVEVPITIADWIVAYNHPDLPKITLSSILLGDITKIGDILEIHDPERIVRILQYAERLEDDTVHFDDLPEDVLNLIFQELDCKDIILACTLSPTLKKYCQPRLHTWLSSRLGVTNKSLSDMITICRLQFTYRQRIANNNNIVYFIGREGKLSGKELISNGPFVEVISFGNGILALRSNGQLYAIGDVHYLNLDYSKTFRPIPGLKNIIGMSIISGQGIFVLKDNGYVYGNGDLAVRNNFDPTTFHQRLGLESIKKISSYANIALFLRADKRVLMLDKLSLTNTLEPPEVFEYTDVIDISTASNYGVMFTHDMLHIVDMNDVYSIVFYGISQVMAGDDYGLILTQGGNLYKLDPKNNYEVIPISPPSPMKRILSNIRNYGVYLLSQNDIVYILLYDEFEKTDIKM